jgi:hypothetical protein
MPQDAAFLLDTAVGVGLLALLVVVERRRRRAVRATRARLQALATPAPIGRAPRRRSDRDG